MKKVGLIIIAVIAASVLLSNVGSLVGLAICVAIMYYAFKGFRKTHSVGKRIVWLVVGLMAFNAAASNFPAIVAVVAAIALYMVYKGWKENEHKAVVQEDSDPFTNFERQWAEIQKNR
ncbi:flagellar basal body rod protein [Bacillus sp. HMF5848]|uniref:lmo0954 family membrane protein n=1 Tax=Bacillus sp. HMF5848 TaxID=2495421 RepID=UPI000F78C29E|nr:flagellar basal body rod protein [Bacillus sp. HMF5848]RSK28253.1 flagellar basal body rod protein [Bacillus sp. HMF5848]